MTTDSTRLVTTSVDGVSSPDLHDSSRKGISTFECEGTHQGRTFSWLNPFTWGGATHSQGPAYAAVSNFDEDEDQRSEGYNFSDVGKATIRGECSRAGYEHGIERRERCSWVTKWIAPKYTATIEDICGEPNRTYTDWDKLERHSFWDMKNTLVDIAAIFDLGGERFETGLQTVVHNTVAKVPYIGGLVAGTINFAGAVTRFAAQTGFTLTAAALYLTARFLCAAFKVIGIAFIVIMAAALTSPVTVPYALYKMLLKPLYSMLVASVFVNAVPFLGAQIACLKATEGATRDAKEAPNKETLIAINKKYLQEHEKIAEGYSITAPRNGFEYETVGLTLTDKEMEYIIDKLVDMSHPGIVSAEAFNAERQAFADAVKFGKNHGLTREEVFAVIEKADQLPSTLADYQKPEGLLQKAKAHVEKDIAAVKGIFVRRSAANALEQLLVVAGEEKRPSKKSTKGMGGATFNPISEHRVLVDTEDFASV